MSTASTTPWIKARKSDGGNNCVELRRNGTRIEMRNSNDPNGGILSFTSGEIDAMFDGVDNREFHHLLDPA